VEVLPAFTKVSSHGFVSLFYLHRSSIYLVFFKAWIEASTKGAVLLFVASEVETSGERFGISPASAGLLGGMSGGIAQAYATMGKSPILFFAKHAKLVRPRSELCG
jgi:hypothetical protein